MVLCVVGLLLTLSRHVFSIRYEAHVPKQPQCIPNLNSIFEFDACLLESQDFNGFDNSFVIDHGYLTNRSVVVVVGAYKGENIAKLVTNKHPHLILFEPVQEFEEHLRAVFREYERVEFHNFAIGIQEKSEHIVVDGDSSALVSVGQFDSKPSEKRLRKIRVKSFSQYIKSALEKYTKVDLLYINCEGCEYALLADMLKHNWHADIKNILIQFHNQSENLSWGRCLLLHILSSTHRRTFNYPWVWEMWTSL